MTGEPTHTTSREIAGGPTPSLGFEVRRIAALAAPVVATQLGMMTLGMVDLMMVGRLGGEALGAASLGRLWVWGTLIVGLGLVFGLDPIFSQAFGARDRRRLGLALQQGLVVSLGVSLPIGLFWLATETILLAGGQDPQQAAMAHRYVLVQLPALPTVLAFNVLRQYLQGRGIVRPAMWILLGANVLNVIANWALIFGHLGFPALGLEGAGIATALIEGFILAAMIAWIRVFRLQRAAWVGWSRHAFDTWDLRRILAFGLPVGLQMGLEMWAFGIATLMAGALGEVELAAHTIVLNLASLSFMVPLGISIGAVTRVGNLIGAGRPRQAQRAAWVALALGMSAMAGAALLFVGLRHELPRLYVSAEEALALEGEVLALAALILPIAAAFQVFDGLQVVGSGVLRGMGRTRPAAVFNAIGYYVLALPLAWWLTHGLGWGLSGIWWGLALGLMTVALLLVVWIGRRGPAHVDARVV